MPKSLRILWLSHFLPYPPKGGALQRSHYLLKEMANRHELHLVALNQRAILATPEALTEASEALGRIVASLRWYPMTADPGSLRWFALLGSTYLRRAPYDLTWLENEAMAAGLRAVAGTGFDLIHMDTLGLWPYRRHLPPTPIVLNHHNVESQLMARRGSLEARSVHRHYFAREARKLRRLEQEACPAARMNVAVSALDVERFRELAPTAAFRVVENGVDTDYFHPSDRAVVPGSLVFVGGLDWYPNRDAAATFMADIWPRVVATRPDATVAFVGRDPPSSLSEHPDKRVTAPGFVPDVRPYLEAAEVYVCPMRDGGGTRLKILDALASAKALVATSVGVEGIDLRDGVHYLAANTPEEFAAAIRRLQADSNLRRLLGANGRRLMEERYAWSRIGATLEDAYQTALAADKATDR